MAVISPEEVFLVHPSATSTDLWRPAIWQLERERVAPSPTTSRVTGVLKTDEIEPGFVRSSVLFSKESRYSAGPNATGRVHGLHEHA